MGAHRRVCHVPATWSGRLIVDEENEAVDFVASCSETELRPNQLVNEKEPMESVDARRSSFGSISTKLASLSREQIFKILKRSNLVHEGIGGQARQIELDGKLVFIKRIAISDRELLFENERSTVNFAKLPLWCLYRLGAPSFNVWRELLAHTASTNWVISGQCANVPILYHWRLLRDSKPAPMNKKDAHELEQNLHKWGNPKELREHVQARQNSSSELLLFLESIPQNLLQFLKTEIERHGDNAIPTILSIEKKLHEAIANINARGLLHMDAHFENILTDGEEVFFTDFGLALSTLFDLSSEEQEFFQQHRDYDRCNLIMSFAQVAVIAQFGEGQWAEKLSDFLAGRLKARGPQLASFLNRNAPVAMALRAFFLEGVKDIHSVDFPAQRLSQLLADFDKG